MLEAPVTASNCFACHGGLERTEFDGLRFDHNKHFSQGVRCQSCHQEYPHTPQGLVKPKMEACFNCHGLNHGNQGERATGKCEACHTKDFDLVPADHTPGWINAGHKNIDRNNPNCSMCHTSGFCNDCHEKQSANNFKLPDLKPNNSPVKSRGLKIVTTGNIKASMCTPCHGNFDREKFDTLNFKHSVHFDRGIACDKCHTTFPHRREQQIKPVTDIPAMGQCFKCHGLSHGDQKTFATGTCSACHPVGFKLKPSSHDENWIKNPPFNHKKEAKADRNQCSMCHQQKFCNDCHGLDPIPHEATWKDGHGTITAKISRRLTNPTYQQTACNNCHKPQQFCTTCHKGVQFPHEQDWPNQHGKIAVSKGKDACYTCHRQQLCTGCHKGVEMPHAEGWLGKHRTALKDDSYESCLRCHVKEQCEQCHSSHKVHNRNKQYNFSLPRLSQ